MKLLYIVQSFAPGGVRTRILTFASATAEEFEHEVVVLETRGDDANDLGELGGTAGVRLRKARRVHLGNLIQLRKLLLYRRPDLLITHNWGTIEAALANRVKPVCNHLHWEVGFSGPYADKPEPARRAVARWLAIGPHSTLCLPSHSLSKVARERWRIPHERIELVANGIDTARFTLAPVEPPSHSSTIIVGTLARLGTEKNVGRLLRVFSRAHLPAVAKLVIGGDGPERLALERLSSALSISDRTEFVGHVADPAQFLRQLHIFALTSDTEQMPFSLLEAMASGLPVVATDVGDVRAMLSPENRRALAPPTDEGELSRHLSILAGSTELRTRLGRANAEWVRAHFDQARMIARYRRLIHQIAAKSKS